ncbi:class I SAM-dependent methyltransferase [Rhodobacteraceae bacterium NNCM2]|nr:class I SAM-dependent methyltransferase [Coraliihabitans acroporae]
MPQYDDFAGTYQHWSETDGPYRIVELHSFFSTVGPVAGLHALDLAAGEGRTARRLIKAGAASVLGADVSAEMIRRAEAQSAGIAGLRFIVLDASDPDFELPTPVDLVTAMYLLHYAPTEEVFQAIADLVSRNLKPGGRFVTYTISPDYDFSALDPELRTVCGFDYSIIDGNHLTLNIGDERVNIWQWSHEVHRERLERAGLTDIRWHGLECPTGASDAAERIAFYIANPSCKVLTAVKPG